MTIEGPSVSNLLEAIINAFDRLWIVVLPHWLIKNQWVDLLVAACLFSAGVVMVMRMTGERVGRRRRQVLASAYELLLYRRVPRAVIFGELRLVKHYLLMLVALIPVMAAAVAAYCALRPALEARYAYRPLAVGEDFVCRITTRAEGDDRSNIFFGESDVAVTARVEVPARRTTWVRCKALHSGVVPVYQSPFPTPLGYVNVAQPNRTIHPRIDADFASVHIGYPPSRSWRSLGGWTTAFFTSSLLLAVPLAHFLKVGL